MASVGTIKYKNGSSWIDILHPVNSFYFSYAPTSPSSLFGGTWTQVTNAALRGASSVGYTGADTHALTINEMPSHNHKYNTGSWLGFWGNNSNMVATQTYAGDGYTIRATSNFTDGTLTGVNRGGGQHIQSCNAPSIVISGIALRRQIRGEW